MRGRLFGLIGQGLRLVLHRGRGRPKSEVRLLLRLVLGWAILLGLLLGDLFLGGGIGRGISLGLGPYMRRSLNLCSPCIHNFSIIGGRRL